MPSNVLETSEGMQAALSQIMKPGDAFKNGVTAIGQGKLKTALEAFHQACAGGSPVPRHQLYRAWTRYQLLGQEKNLSDEQATAVRTSCRMTIIYALMHDRRFDAGYVLLGTIFLGERRQERARQCFFKALSINPKNAGAQMGLKNCGEASSK